MKRKPESLSETLYPHILKKAGICGGEAIIEETRIAVWHVVEYFYRGDMSIDDILTDWDYLKPAQIFSALAYYHDNKEEIEQVRRENSYESWQDQFAHASA